MALSIFVPIGYITILVVSLSIFSRVYRKRTAQALVREHGLPWFPEGHPERDIYQTLVQASSSSSSSSAAGSENVVPDVVLKAALLNRAMADVRRIIRMRDDKQALGVLLQKGSIGDETMAKFTMAEKELEAEILDVVSEANTFREGWGQLIFPTASEMVAHLKHKDIYYGIQQQREDEIKRLKEEGRPIPQPNVTLPPMITPAGTSITIKAPNPSGGTTPPQPGNGAAGAQKLAEVAAAVAAHANASTNGSSAGKKSGTVEEADDEIPMLRGIQDCPVMLEGYADLQSPSAFLTSMNDEFNGELDDGFDEDSDCSSCQGGGGGKAIELIFKDPTPNPSPEAAALVEQFVAQQSSNEAGGSGRKGKKKRKRPSKQRAKVAGNAGQPKGPNASLK